VRERQSEFEAVVLPHAATLLRFGRRHCGSDAEDLVQETLLRAWRGLSSFQRGSNPRAWLFRILLNTWHSEGRRRRARPAEMPLHEAMNRMAGSCAEVTEINEALARLSEEHRAVLLLAAVEGFTCREMAVILAVPIGTVMSRLSRARVAMREMVPSETRKAEAGLR